MLKKQDIVTKSFGDFFSPKVLFLSLLSFVLTISIIGLAIFLISDNLSSLQNFVLDYFDEFEAGFIKDIQNYPLVEFFLKYKEIMTWIHYFLMFGLWVTLYYIFFIVYSFVISFFIFLFINYIHKKYYPEVELKGINIFSSIFFFLKTVIITLILFILLIPAYFIPAFNILIFVPLYYFFHKTLVFDVSSIINNKAEYKKIKSVNWGALKEKTIFCYLISLIPIIGVFMFPFYVILLGHYIFNETKELRNVTTF